MDNTVKIFIVSVVLLYTVMGFAIVGFIQGDLLNNNIATINQANSPANDAINNQTAKTNPQNKTISSLKAINIVYKKVPDYPYTSYTTKLVQNGQHPYYVVNAYDKNPNSTTYNQGIGGAVVDAKTGNLLDNGTITHI